MKSQAKSKKLLAPPGSQESSDPEKIIRTGYGELHRREIFKSLSLSTKCKSYFRRRSWTSLPIGQ
jgi:hypothetical protein